MAPRARGRGLAMTPCLFQKRTLGIGARYRVRTASGATLMPLLLCSRFVVRFPSSWFPSQ